jgi:hypothetical protein
VVAWACRAGDELVDVAGQNVGGHERVEQRCELLTTRWLDVVLGVKDLQHALDGLGGLVDGVLEVLRCAEPSLAQRLLELSSRPVQALIVQRS